MKVRIMPMWDNEKDIHVWGNEVFEWRKEAVWDTFINIRSSESPYLLPTGIQNPFLISRPIGTNVG